VYDIARFVAAIRRRRRLALALFVLFAIVGAILVKLIPETYATSSEVLVKRPDTQLQSTTYPEIDALLAWKPDTTMETYISLARQPAVAQRVIHTLGLRTTVKDVLAGNVVVTPLTNSDIINIAVDWRDPNGSARIANAFARTFIERQRELAASQAAEAAASLSVALNKAQSDLADSERALTLFEARNQLADAPTQTTSILASISDVQSKERAVGAERVQAEGQLSSSNGQLAQLPGTIDASQVISRSPSAAQLEQQLSQQQLNLRILQRQFTARYPEVVSAENQIATLQSELKSTAPTSITSRNVEPNPLAASLASQAATLQAQIAGNSAQLRLLRSQEASLLAQLRVFPASVSELSTLQRRQKAAETIYDALQNNYFNAVVARSMAVSDLSIVQYADPALATVRPPKALAFIVAILVAAVIALGIVGLLEWSPEERMAVSAVR
jgi:uncharacterized protein involved in exopolysaccharide biosynthesis